MDNTPAATLLHPSLLLTSVVGGGGNELGAWEGDCGTACQEGCCEAAEGALSCPH